jgi:hypothetical protein
MVGKMINKNLFDCCLIGNLKIHNYKLESPYLKGFEDINLFDCCLLS